MNFKIEILISVLFSVYILFEFIRINIFKKSNNALLGGLASLLLIGFGGYMWIKYGLILDYDTDVEIENSKAILMYAFAFVSTLVGFTFITISIVKFTLWKIKKH